MTVLPGSAGIKDRALRHASSSRSSGAMAPSSETCGCRPPTYTFAQSAEKRVDFQGTANGLRSADLELTSYRRVRFDAAELG